ncbi:LOW QUALITY PROTEIN: hypothetical protein HID58_034470, partial [Brassica napus]
MFWSSLNNVVKTLSSLSTLSVADVIVEAHFPQSGWRLVARSGDQRLLHLAVSSHFVAAPSALLSFDIFGLGFDPGKCSAAEGFDYGGSSGISGTMARRSRSRWWQGRTHLKECGGLVEINFLSSRSRPTYSVCEKERIYVCSRSSAVRCSWPGVFRLWRVALVGFSNVRVLLLSVVCAGGFLYHGGEFVSFNTQMGWCLSSLAGSRWSSPIPLYCALFSYSRSWNETVLASPISVRRFSAVMGVWWFSGLLELCVVVCLTIVCRLGSVWE